MRNSLKLLALAVVVAIALAAVPAASADSVTITDNVSVGGMQIGTIMLTQGGMCNGVSISSTSVCVDIQMTSGTVRLGGPVIGFSGNVNVGGTTMVSDVSVGSLSIGACGGVTNEAICLDTTGSATTSSLFFVLSNAETASGISIGNLHVAGTFCGSSPTCFATTTEMSTVPEPGTLGMLGAGLVGLAGLTRRRFLSQN